MSALVRCPKCDTFVKPHSISASACPFCPSQTRNLRNAIPGMVLAATLAAVPACSGSTTASAPEPEHSVTTDEPESEHVVTTDEPEAPKKEALDASVPVSAEKPVDVDVYGIAPDMD